LMNFDHGFLLCLHTQKANISYHKTVSNIQISMLSTKL
jgi:hypothetical protein